MSWSTITDNISGYLSDHGPEILTGLGIFAGIATTVLAVVATPDAVNNINRYKKKHDLDKLTIKETVSVTWKCYAKTAVVGVSAIGLVVAGARIQSGRTTAATMAVAAAESVYTEYRRRVVQHVGAEQEETISKNMHSRAYTPEETAIFSQATVPAYDIGVDRYLNVCVKDLLAAENRLNKKMRTDQYKSLNDFYSECNSPLVTYGDELGWNIDDDIIELRFVPHLKDYTPCLGFEFINPPRSHYKD